MRRAEASGQWEERGALGGEAEMARVLEHSRALGSRLNGRESGKDPDLMVQIT